MLLYIRANTLLESRARVGPELFKAYLLMLLSDARIGSLFSLCYACPSASLRLSPSLRSCLFLLSSLTLCIYLSLVLPLFLCLSLGLSLLRNITKKKRKKKLWIDVKKCPRDMGRGWRKDAIPWNLPREVDPALNIDEFARVPIRSSGAGNDC